VSDEPKYSDQQMALILKRAAELQAVGDERSHSLESIQEIARQVGIDPHIVADVAASLEQGKPDSTLFGASSAFRIARQVSGTFDPANPAPLLATIRDILPVGGATRQVGNGFEWHAGSSDVKTIVSLSPNPNGVSLRIDARHHGIKGLSYIGGATAGVFAAVFSIATMHGPGVLVGAAALAASLAGTRALWNRYVLRQTKRFQALSNALAKQLESPDTLAPGSSDEHR
jgi:hypothetical protein